MTLPYNQSRAIFNGNGVATSFPFGFKVWSASQLVVSVTDPSGKSASVTGWSVTLTETGGVISYTHSGGALPIGWKLVVLRNMPFVQKVALISGTQFDPQVIEDHMDQATAERQQLLEGVRRAVKIEESSEQSPEELISGIYQSRDEAAASAAAAAQSAVEAATSAGMADGRAKNSKEDALKSCICADRAEAARDVALEQNALVNTLIAVETGKINVLIAANKDDQQAAVQAARKWSDTPENIPVIYDEDGNPAYSALHWAEKSSQLMAADASKTKKGVVRVGKNIDVDSNGLISVSASTETARGIGRIATAAEVGSGKTGENGPAFVTPETFYENFINDKICQYSWFEDDLQRKGYFSCLGGVVSKFAKTYPMAAAYFETEHGKKRLVTQDQYDALHVATWHTNADGTKVGWNGIGGVNKFVWDKAKDTLRLPDLAGMTPEHFGYDPLGVGGVRGDGIRNFSGYVEFAVSCMAGTGPFAISNRNNSTFAVNVNQSSRGFLFNPATVVPIGPRNHGPRYISDARVYLGQPAL